MRCTLSSQSQIFFFLNPVPTPILDIHVTPYPFNCSIIKKRVIIFVILGLADFSGAVGSSLPNLCILGVF